MVHNFIKITSYFHAQMMMSPKKSPHQEFTPPKWDRMTFICMFTQTMEQVAIGVPNYYFSHWWLYLSDLLVWYYWRIEDYQTVSIHHFYDLFFYAKYFSLYSRHTFVWITFCWLFGWMGWWETRKSWRSWCVRVTQWARWTWPR